MSKYPQYSHKFCPLTDPAEDLRIFKITLSSTSHEDKVEGQILQFEEKQEYAALSWCWGPRDAPKTTMRITHNDQPYDFEISVALDSALKQLRRYKVEYIWIDQICINQDDFSERNNQVRLMARIYTRAQLVYVWLGEAKEGDSEDSGAAFKFIDTGVLKLKYFDHLVKDENVHKDWNNMVELMKREWFSRRWVVQEIALARDAVILCGPHRINWLEFADAVSLFNDAEAEKQTISRAIMMGKKEYGFKPRYFGYVPALSATRLVEVTNDLFRRRADHEKAPLLSLEQLVSTFTAFNASEPRDTIYAVLAIAKDTMPRTSHANMRSMVASYKRTIQEKFIEQLSQKIVAKSYYVNYEQPVSDVFVDFIDFAISQSEKTRALDIICRPWAPTPGLQGLNDDGDNPWRAVFDSMISTRGDGLGTDSLPSWIPNITGAAYGLEPKTKRMVRKNPDTLVGLPPQRHYTAAGTISVTKALRFEQGITRFSKYENLNGIHYHSMFVEGFVVDKVQNLRTASQKGNIPKDWAQLGRQYAHEGEQWKQLPDEYWRTLVADRGKKGNPPRHYPRLITHALESHVQGETFFTQEEIDHPDCQAVSDVLERVQSVIWNRRLMRTKDKRLGLVPEHAEKGDLIVILYGCSVPVVLRRFTKTKAEVEEEAKTKLTRQHKMAARKILETFRKSVAHRKQQQEGKSLSSRQSTGGSGVPNQIGDDVGGVQAATQGHDFGGSNEQNEHSMEQRIATAQQNLEHVNEEVNRAYNQDADTISISGERPVRMPGAWLETTPPLSRKGTDLVAPGPILPQSFTELCRTTSTASTAATAKATDSVAKPTEPPLKADEYTFYQLIGECYLHGMMDGEAIPMQRSAEDDAKQKNTQEREKLAAVRKVTEKEKEMPNREYIKSLQRSITEPTEPSTKAKEVKTPEGPVEPALFMRTLFELR